MLIIRLQRKGRRHLPFYWVVVAQKHKHVSKKIHEKLGTYNPLTKELVLDKDRAKFYIDSNVGYSDSAAVLLEKEGLIKREMVDYSAQIKAKEDAAKEVAKKKAEEAKIAADAAKAEKAKEEAEAKVAAEEAAAVEAPVEEVKTEEPVAEPVETPAEEPKTEEKAEEPAADAKPDDLTKVEGVGPKIAEVLTAGGVVTFANLAEAKVEVIAEMIKDVRGNHVPDTWPNQAKLAAEGKWEELQKLQDELDGGKPA